MYFRTGIEYTFVGREVYIYAETGSLHAVLEKRPISPIKYFCTSPPLPVISFVHATTMALSLGRGIGFRFLQKLKSLNKSIFIQ